MGLELKAEQRAGAQLGDRGSDDNPQRGEKNGVLELGLARLNTQYKLRRSLLLLEQNACLDFDWGLYTSKRPESKKNVSFKARTLITNKQLQLQKPTNRPNKRINQISQWTCNWPFSQWCLISKHLQPMCSGYKSFLPEFKQCVPVS